jgi:hypothetical protein
MDDLALLRPSEVDRLLRYPRGRSARLARRGVLPHVKLPDGEIRFHESQIAELVRPALAKRGQEVPHAN